jgi:hypothetical protein
LTDAQEEFEELRLRLQETMGADLTMAIQNEQLGENVGEFQTQEEQMEVVVQEVEAPTSSQTRTILEEIREIRESLEQANNVDQEDPPHYSTTALPADDELAMMQSPMDRKVEYYQQRTETLEHEVEELKTKQRESEAKMQGVEAYEMQLREWERGVVEENAVYRTELQNGRAQDAEVLQSWVRRNEQLEREVADLRRQLTQAAERRE